MPKFAKGSQEAKDWAKRMADARAVKAGRKPVGEFEDVSIKKMGTPQLILPEYFATRTKKGWKLVNPLTQERNLSTRWGETSIKLSRKPVADAVYLDGDNETIHLSLFPPKDREVIRNTFLKGIADNSSKSLDKKPNIGMGEILERGRPEKLPKNIEINRERRAEAKKANAKPKGRPSKYGADEEARKQAKKEQDKIANQKRTEKRKAEKAKGKGLSDSESSDEEIKMYLAQGRADAKAEDIAKAQQIAQQQNPQMRRPVARKPKAKSAGGEAKSAGGEAKVVQSRTMPLLMFQPTKGTKRKMESPDTSADGKGFKGFNRLSQENIVLTMDESGEFPKLIKKETIKDLRILHKELKTQLREAKAGMKTPTSVAEHNDLRKKIKELEAEFESRKMSGTGRKRTNLKKDIARARDMAMELGTITEEKPPGKAPFVPALDEPLYIAYHSTAQLKRLLKRAIQERDEEYANELKKAITDREQRDKMAKSSSGSAKPIGFLRDGKRVYGEGTGIKGGMIPSRSAGGARYSRTLFPDSGDESQPPSSGDEMSVHSSDADSADQRADEDFWDSITGLILELINLTGSTRQRRQELFQETILTAYGESFPDVLNNFILSLRRANYTPVQIDKAVSKLMAIHRGSMYIGESSDDSAGSGNGVFSKITGKPKNKISTTNIDRMPKKSKMTDSGMGLYAGMAEPAGRGFFGDLAKSALKAGGNMAVDAGANYLKNKMAGSGMYAGIPSPALPPSGMGMNGGCGMCGMGMYAGDGLYAGMPGVSSGYGLYAGMAEPSGRGMCGSGMCGQGMVGGLIYNPNNDPDINAMNDHIRMVMGHHLQLGMAGKGIFGSIGRWFKKAGQTINDSVIKPVGRAFSKGGVMEQIGKTIGGVVIRQGLPALANLASDAIGQPELGALATPLASQGADALATSLGVGIGGKPKKPNAWIALVKRVQKEKGVSYKEAMTIASQMRR